MTKPDQPPDAPVDRRRDADFSERIGRGLRTATDLMRRASSGRPAPAAAPTGGASRGWDLERLSATIASTAARFLGAPAMDPDADFFNLGGTSVAAVELLAQLGRDLGVQISLDDVFADARPRRLAERWLGRAATPSPALPLALPITARAPAHADDLQALAADVALADQLPWVDAPPREVPRRILLTGATGFLGSHVLFDLLRTSDAHVTCLVRAADDRDGAQRLAAELAIRDLPWSSELQRRITIVAGDVRQPQLGLTDDRWRGLADELDAIVNVAAAVDFLRGYPSLRSSNVLGPLTLAALATTGRPKPLHHVSTVSVFDEPGIRAIGEDDPVAHAPHLTTGYEQTKWAAEAALRRARERGLVATVFRPGGIGGHTHTGVYNPHDLSSGIMAAWQLLRMLPEFRYMTTAPVDWMSRIIAEVVLDPDAWGHNYHLVGQPQTLREVMRDMSIGGMRVHALPFDDWRQRFLAHMEAEPIPHLAYLARVLQSASASRLIEATLDAPAPTADRTDAFLRRRGLPRRPRYDGRAQLATFERLARDGRGKLPGRADPPYLRFSETLAGTIHPVVVDSGAHGAGGDVIAETPCRAHLQLSVASFHQLLEQRRIDLHGTLSCAALHPAPLQVETGDCWVRPDDGVPDHHGPGHPLLRYRITLRAADGQLWWLTGTKTARPGRDPWRQGRTLHVELGPDGAPASHAGVLVVPAASYVPEQIDGIEVDPSLPAHERRVAKLIWLAWFGAQFSLGFLDPMLRALVEIFDGIPARDRQDPPR